MTDHLEEGHDCSFCARMRASTMSGEAWTALHTGTGHAIEPYEDRGPGYLITGRRCSCGAKIVEKAGPNPDERDDAP